MSVDTRGKIKGKISYYDIFNYIKHTIDKNASMNISTSNYGSIDEYDFVKENYDDSNCWIINSGFIYFTSKNGNERSLFYFYDNCNHYENLEYYTPLGLADMVKSETTTLSLGQNDEAVEIIKDIIAQFGGGWIDEYDCDDIPYEPVPEKNEKGEIPSVIHITKKELYEKFGGVVVIDDYNV
jgi:hypothetical protein